MRHILSFYLKVNPLLVQLIYGPGGKPAVNPEIHDQSWQFNFTHSGELALLAVAHGCRLGVDVEPITELPDASQLADQYFLSEEADKIAACSESERSKLFLHLWTAKEAYLKARGVGLTRLLDEFRVVFRDDEQSYVVPIKKASGPKIKWHLYPLTPELGYVGAVVCERVPSTNRPRLLLMEFTPNSATCAPGAAREARAPNGTTRELRQRVPIC